MTTAEQLVDLVIAEAPELAGRTVTEEQLAAARQVARERTADFPKGNRVALAALVDLIVHELTRENA